MNPNFFTLLHVYRTGGSSSSSDSDSLSDKENSEDEVVYHHQSDLPLLFLGQEIVRQREGGDNALNTSNHPLDVPPNSDSSSGESSDAGDESIPPTPTLPPSPWRNSTAKANIIKALKDETSDIHLFIGAFGPNNWKEVIFEQIRQKYAQRYAKSNFRENFKRLLIHFQNTTGDFSTDMTDGKWYTSVNNVSKGYSLLFSLYMDPTHSKRLKEMTIEQIWKSDRVRADVAVVVAHSSVTREEINFQSLHQQPKRNGHRHQWHRFRLLH